MSRPTKHVAAAEAARIALAAIDVPDAHGSFAEAGIAALREAGLLAAPLASDRGGADLCAPERVDALRHVLTAIGRASLVLGRLYEGHVNALALVLRYGDARAQDRAGREAREGHLFGVWNTEPEPGGLAIDGARLSGAKSYASGAGFVTRPLVTARQADGRRLMLVVALDGTERADLSAWRAQGMRATATGTLDFTGLPFLQDQVVGEPDDYFRQPFFSCGAWRFLAVQCGGIEAVFEAHREHLRRSGRGDDPHQRARLGQAAAAVETARLFVARAARHAAAAETDPEGAVAYVNLARGAVERAGLDAIALAQRSVGLSGFLEAHPLERRARDLATYLRQPAPDYALASAAGHVLNAAGPLHATWPDATRPDTTWPDATWPER